MITAIETGRHRRLEQLYEVSKLFTSFASVDDTVGKALQIVAAMIPLESAHLIRATITYHTEITVWRCEDSAPARMLAARAHAESVYAYLVGARSADILDLRDRIGSAILPAPRGRCVPREQDRRFIIIPLVVARGSVFGALQIEAASEPDRDDVEFVNAVANQLAIALDRDRTQRHDVVRRREAQLSRERYESLVDRLDSAFIWEADLETRRISYVSAQVERLLGFSRRQCLDEHDWWRSRVHPDDCHLVEKIFARALAEPGDQRCDHRCVTAHDAVVWLHTCVHVADVPGEPPRFQGLSRDITAAKADQDRLRHQLAFASAMHDEARRAIAAREQALAVASHELLSPLATIALASEVLGDDLSGSDHEASLGAIARIQRATERMERMIRDLVDVASIDPATARS